METRELEQRIAAFPRWNYRFQFDGGISTPVARIGQINRHEQRRRYFFEALLSVLGGTLAGQRVLDLGCNAGSWALQSLQAGADFVLGIDVEGQYIEQAQLVFSAKGADPGRYRFERADLFQFDYAEPFDVVLCLGVMEATARPLELFEIFKRVQAKIVVIDTAISPARFGCFELARADDVRDRTRQRVVLLPSAEAVPELAGEFGMQAVALAHNMTDYAGMDDYRERRRFAFVLADGVSLDALADARAEPPPAPAWRQALDPHAHRQASERLLSRRGWRRG